MSHTTITIITSHGNYQFKYHYINYHSSVTNDNIVIRYMEISTALCMDDLKKII